VTAMIEPQPERTIPSQRHVVFIDGTCVYCNWFVHFLLKHDAKKQFFFAYLQGGYARAALQRHSGKIDDIDGIYLLLHAGTPSETLLLDGRAAREIYPRLFPSLIFVRWIPLFLLNAFYRLFARYRYRLFGRYNACRIPTVEERKRWIESE